jgi:TPR repeat protein
MTEAELEDIAQAQNSSNARYVLGKLLLEGLSDKIAKNPVKGINWLKEAIRAGNLDALEYKAYYDIRYDPVPKLKKIQEALEQVVDKNKSARACNTLAEFYYAQDKLENHKELASKYYNHAKDAGCLLGGHWMGVFYHKGFGVGKNVGKAIELLQKSAKAGNGQSLY